MNGEKTRKRKVTKNGLLKRERVSVRIFELLLHLCENLLMSIECNAVKQAEEIDMGREERIEMIRSVVRHTCSEAQPWMMGTRKSISDFAKLLDVNISSIYVLAAKHFVVLFDRLQRKRLQISLFSTISELFSANL